MKFRIFLVAFLCLGCTPIETITRYENITRVFMHGTHKVSFFIPHDNNEIRHIILYNEKHFIKYIQDVPAEDPMWAIKRVKTEGCILDEQIEVHIHSVEDVNGGSYNYGKSGLDSINVVE